MGNDSAIVSTSRKQKQMGEMRIGRCSNGGTYLMIFHRTQQFLTFIMLQSKVV